MKIIFLGPPGSGKGTISAIIAKNMGIFHLSPGEVLREEVKKETSLGVEIKRYIEAGDLVPDKFVVEVVKLEVGNRDGFILDGFPRSIGQAEEIESLGIDHVIYLKMEEEAIVKRLSGRRVCAEGKHTYHIVNIPPKKEGICDVDGSGLVRRKDDDPEVIRERFRVYNEKTQPLVEFYEKKGLLREIDANQSPDMIVNDVMRVLK